LACAATCTWAGQMSKRRSVCDSHASSLDKRGVVWSGDDAARMLSEALSLASECPVDAVFHSGSEHFGPLADSRMRHAQRLGRSRDRASKEVDGGGFKHSGPMLADLHTEHKRTNNHSAFNCTYMSTLQERIAELMDETGWSVGQMAEIAGVSSSAATQWKDGPTMSIKLEPAVRLSAKCGYSALWIATGKGPKKAVIPPGDGILEPEFAGAPRPPRQVPVVGTAKLGSDGFYEEMSPVVGAGDGHIEIATEDPNAYGLRVRGQSMFPAIRDGWYVLVEPNGRPAIGEYVLVKLITGQKMVKELLNSRAGSYEVVSVNGGERMTFHSSEIDSVQAVGAVVSPSKWRPE